MNTDIDWTGDAPPEVMRQVMAEFSVRVEALNRLRVYPDTPKVQPWEADDIAVPLTRLNNAVNRRAAKATAGYVVTFLGDVMGRPVEWWTTPLGRALLAADERLEPVCTQAEAAAVIGRPIGTIGTWSVNGKLTKAPNGKGLSVRSVIAAADGEAS